MSSHAETNLESPAAAVGTSKPQKKKIKWQKQKRESGSGGLGTSSTSMDASSSRKGNQIDSPSSSSSSSTMLFLGRFLAFLFSPLGIVTIFVTVNYPWLKRFIGISPATPVTSTSVMAPSSEPSTSTSSQMPIMSKISKSSSKKLGSLSWNSTSGGNTTLMELSMECQNPIKKFFDKDCRLQVKELRRRKKLLKQQKAQENHMTNASYVNQTLVNWDTTTSTTAAAPSTSAPSMNDEISSSSHNGDPIVLKLGGNLQPVKLSIDSLECKNIFSRECRQKKRLLANMVKDVNQS